MRVLTATVNALASPPELRTPNFEMGVADLEQLPAILKTYRRHHEGFLGKRRELLNDTLPDPLTGRGTEEL